MLGVEAKRHSGKNQGEVACDELKKEPIPLKKNSMRSAVNIVENSKGKRGIAYCEGVRGWVHGSMCLRVSRAVT